MAAGRRRTLERELAGKVQFDRRAYLLLPGEGQRPTYDEYVVSHRVRAAEMMPELGFAIPKVGQKYPRSSVPAQLVAAAVQDEQPERLVAMEDQLFGAMFRELRDISDPKVLREIARATGIPEAEVDAAIDSSRLRHRAAAEHDEGEAAGITGIPALVIPGLPPITGAVPIETYRQALIHALG